MESDFSKPIRNVSKMQPLDNYLSGSWDALGSGAPVLVALAQLSAEAMVTLDATSYLSADLLMPESKAILYAAKDRGVIELKGVNAAFEAPSRMLAVYVELDEVQTIAFRDPNHPETTVRFLEGFRALCKNGLVMHHIHRDFSLTSRGFELARTLTLDEVQPWLNKGTEFGLHD
jgi:hypothetical protein